MLINAEIFGFMSGILCSLSLIPQIYKSYTTKSSQDISTKTLCLMYCALIIGIIYGIIIKHAAVYVMNGISIILYIILHGVKIRNEHTQLQPQPRVQHTNYVALDNEDIISSHEKNESVV